LSETQTRSRLAAILAADAVGYSRLMSADDHATVAALDAARAVFRQHIQASQGRVVDMAGDSVLAVFETAAGAVSAALGTQRDLEIGTTEVPSDRRLLFRIGVHLGDVIEKGDGTVYGDGVNIAARLQALAPAGGVVISDAVRGSVKNRIAARFVDLGKQTVKNIAEPVRAFQVQGAEGKAPARAAPRRVSRVAGAVAVVIALIVGAGWYTLRGGQQPVAETADSKSIAVLPFANISDDKDTAYFADGVHEDLLTQLALLGDLKVISRVSVMDYRNTKKNVRQIGSELGVASVVEGSVRRAGNQVRVTAQLIDARSDKHLWAKSYDRELKDIFAIQSELAVDIAKSLKVSLDPQESQRLAKRPTNNLEAYDLFLRHQQLVHRFAGSIGGLGATRERISLLEKAVALDPDFALAWARLAVEYIHSHSYSIDRAPETLTKAASAIQRAQTLAGTDPLVQIEVGNYYVYVPGEQARAAKAFEDVLATRPNNVDALHGLADVRICQLQWADRVALLERALAVDARNPQTLTSLLNSYYVFRRYDRALALQEEIVKSRPDDLDAKAKLYVMDYNRTGSWEAYDKWRATLPKGAERKSARVMFRDMDRAIARHDFNEALRLLEIQAEDLKVYSDLQERAFRERDRALILSAKGDKAAARKSAEVALRLMDAELQNMPDESSVLSAKSWLLALLGRRDEAFALHARYVESQRVTGNLWWLETAQREVLALHALLGDRKAALAEAARQLKLPGVRPYNFLNEIVVAPLWDDPEFLALINDPANNAPVSFDVK